MFSHRLGRRHAVPHIEPPVRAPPLSEAAGQDGLFGLVTLPYHKARARGQPTPTQYTPDHQSFMGMTQNNQTKRAVSRGFLVTNGMNL
jgi:hypothetical protein